MKTIALLACLIAIPAFAAPRLPATEWKFKAVRQPLGPVGYYATIESTNKLCFHNRCSKAYLWVGCEERGMAPSIYVATNQWIGCGNSEVRYRTDYGTHTADWYASSDCEAVVYPDSGDTGWMLAYTMWSNRLAVRMLPAFEGYTVANFRPRNSRNTNRIYAKLHGLCNLEGYEPTFDD